MKSEALTSFLAFLRFPSVDEVLLDCSTGPLDVLAVVDINLYYHQNLLCSEQSYDNALNLCYHVQ